MPWCREQPGFGVDHEAGVHMFISLWPRDATTLLLTRAQAKSESIQQHARLGENHLKVRLHKQIMQLQVDMMINTKIAVDYPLSATATTAVCMAALGDEGICFLLRNSKASSAAGRWPRGRDSRNSGSQRFKVCGVWCQSGI